MISFRFLAHAGMLAALYVGIPALGFAQQSHRVGQHFSFAHKRPTFKEAGVTPEVVVSAMDSEGLLSLIDEIWSPSFSTSPHFHKTHAETFYIISGQAEWTVDGQAKVLSAGDCVHVPAYAVHSVKVVGGKDLHTLMLYQPGGFEAQAEYEAKFTPEQLKDPKISAQLRPMGDIHVIPAGSPLPPYPTLGPRRLIQFFSFAGKRPSYPDDGTSDVAVSSADSSGLLSLQDELWEEDFQVGPHRHKVHAETFYILSGRVEWTVGGEAHVLYAGDAVHIPANTVHSARALDGKKLHTLLIYKPGGYDEYLERQASYTPEQLKDPKVRERLRVLSDFNPVEKK
jgi:quercetin 2,3-dioxygenase